MDLLWTYYGLAMDLLGRKVVGKLIEDGCVLFRFIRNDTRTVIVRSETKCSDEANP